MQKRFIGGVFAAVFLSAVFTIARLHAAKSEAPMPAGLALTLYNQQFAVVPQPVGLNPPEGVNPIRYPDPTAALAAQSATPRAPSGEHRLQILDQAYLNQ